MGAEAQRGLGRTTPFPVPIPSAPWRLPVPEARRRTRCDPLEYPSWKDLSP